MDPKDPCPQILAVPERIDLYRNAQICTVLGSYCICHTFANRNRFVGSHQRPSFRSRDERIHIVLPTSSMRYHVSRSSRCISCLVPVSQCKYVRIDRYRPCIDKFPFGKTCTAVVSDRSRVRSLAPGLLPDSPAALLAGSGLVVVCPAAASVYHMRCGYLHRTNVMWL